jgi:hypothetical protein
MNNATTTSFLVSDVAPATTPLEEVPYKEAVDALLRMSVHSRHPRPVEACSRFDAQLIAGAPFHPVVAAAHRAFMDHRPLCLSPDIIWLMVCQGVANHINANAEELRPRIVSHEGKITIDLRRDDFVKGSPENPWAEAIEEFTGKVREHIGSAFDLFQPTFTTTGPVERAAAGVVLLDAMQSYFRYDMESLCGIPAITLEGTPEDWQAIADRAEQFAFLDLEWWLEPLRAVLQQFVTAAQGNVDRPFWRSLYKYREESGGPILTGWISALFPYLTDSETGLATHRNPYLTLDSQRMEDIDLDEEFDDEIDDIEIHDIDLDEEESDDFDEFDEDSESPPAEQPPDRLTLRRKHFMENPPAAVPDPEEASEFDCPSEDEPPRRFIWITADGIEVPYGTDPDLDEDHIEPPYGADPETGEDFGEDDHEERVVGAWLRPMPNRRRDEEDDDADCGWGPRISDLPSGISRAPFRWKYLHQSFDMEFLGGFVGVSQDRETLLVKPEIGWAVREAGTARAASP